MQNIYIHPNLDTIVSLGCALYMGILENKYINNNDVILLDVVPLSLGVEMADGTFSVIIPKNTPIPVKITKKYTSDINNNIKVNVYQGERSIANKNTLIGSFEIKNVSQLPVIDITFKIDDNSLILISVHDKKTGNENNIILKNHNIDKNWANNVIQNSALYTDSDEKEIFVKRNIYIINNYIENALVNLNNSSLSSEKKTDIINRFTEIEEIIANPKNDLTLFNIQLLDILAELELTYKILINQYNYNENENEDEHNYNHYIKKNELESRVKIKLNTTNPNDPVLKSILEEL
jgi:molecular chaperone DnaK (HSP70)